MLIADILRALFPGRSQRHLVLEIDWSTFTEGDCPDCGSPRYATFDVLTLDSTGVAPLMNLARCFGCHPLDPPTR